MTFVEYYEKHYLPLHRHPLTKMLHIVGNVATVLYIGAVVSLSMTQMAYLFGLFLTPFVVYPFAWFSHLFIEKNKPAAWSRPFWAKASDWVMIGELATGNLPLDTRKEIDGKNNSND